MQFRLNAVWVAIIALAFVFSLAYLWFALFPGRAAPEAGQYFSAEQVNRGREYNRVMRLVFIGSFASQAAFLAWLLFRGQGAELSRWIQQLTGGSYWGSLFLFFLAVWLSLRLINLPFTLFGSYFWQHRWGFSTQTMSSWWLDYLKGTGLDLALSAAGVLLLFWIMSRWPGAWWVAGAAFFSLWLVIQTLIWPVVVSPLFNRFVPAKDPAVTDMVRQLSRKARLPVGQVLVMDASRRTTKANAYFAGLGPTKRIVIYDTLLNDYPPDQVEAVLAHEMAHWIRGHIFKGLALGILGSFTAWGLLFLLLRGAVPLPPGLPPPHLWVAVLLFFLLLSFAGSPVENHISRAMEKEADRVAVELTGNVPAAVRLQVNLACKNLSDVSPPAFIQWFSYSHPPVLTRIELIQQAGRP